MSNLLSFLFHLSKLIIIFLFKKLVGTNILKISIENYVRGKRKPQMIRIHHLKKRKREVKENPKLRGQWNVPMFGGQWNIPMFSGQWNIPSFVANGMFQCLVANGIF
jgi:hypothetical protein